MQPITLFPISGIPLIKEGDNIAQAILAALDALNLPLIDGDVLVIAHTIISRALGLVYSLEEITPSEEAIALSAQTNYPSSSSLMVIHAILDKHFSCNLFGNSPHLES